MLSQIQATLDLYQAQPLGHQRKYAVLLPLVQLDGKLHVLFQVRSQAVSQPGDVSFPGGQLEEGETFQDAARRECCEELQINPNMLTLMGEIDYIVNPNAIIRCFVGFLNIPDLDELQPNSDEVDHLFTLPLADLLASSVTLYHSRQDLILDENFPFERIPQGENYPFQTFHHQIPFFLDFQPTIWGFTAQLTQRFLEIISSSNSI